MRSLRVVGFVWLLAVSVVTATSLPGGESKISFRQLTRTHPVAVQRGTSAAAEVSSHFTLNGAHSAFFAPAGPVMEFAESTDAPESWKDPAELDLGTPFRFRVSVPECQLPGVHEFRIATVQSVSSVGHLLVTDYPVVVEESADNDQPAGAQAVTLPATVCGIIDRFEDVDCYRIHGEAGQDLVCQIYAQRVTRAIHCMAVRYPKIHLMDSMLTLLGPDGSLVGLNDNDVGGDSLLHCRLPVSGEYVLQVRDTRYAGDPRYVYAVELSHDPVVLGTIPMAVRQGTPAPAEPIFSAPDTAAATGTSAASSPAAVAVAATENGSAPGIAASQKSRFGGEPFLLGIPESAVSGWQLVRASDSGRTRNPVWLRVSPHPERVGMIDKSWSGEAVPLVVPGGITGRFLAPRQTHRYRFEGRKDCYYRFEVQSEQRGFAVDSVLTVSDAAGKSLAVSDDGYYTKDAVLHFQAPADGDYTLGVRDLNGRSGERYVYLLSAEPGGPDFEIHGEYYYGMLAPGGQAIWFVSLRRLNGFDGPVEMQVDGLPQGVSFTNVTIPAGMSVCSLIFTAAPDAPVNASLVRVTGRAKLPRPDGTSIEAVRDAHVTCELRRAGASAFSRTPIQTQLLAVTRPLDVTKVTADPAHLTLRRGQRAEVRVRIERNPAYSDQVLLDLAFSFHSRKYGEQLPPGVTMSPDSTTKLTGSELEATVILEASPEALCVQDLPIAVLARVPITYSIMTNYASNPIQLTVSAD